MKFILVSILVICGLSNTINAYFPPHGSDHTMRFMHRFAVDYDESLEALADNKDNYNKMDSSEDHDDNDDYPNATEAAEDEDDGNDDHDDADTDDNDNNDDDDDKDNGKQDNDDSNENTSKITADDDEADKYIEDYLKIYAYASNANNPNYDYYNIFKSVPMKLNDEIDDLNSNEENTATSAASDESSETTPTYQTTLGWTAVDSPRGNLLVKIAQSSANSDLLQNEYSTNIADFNMVYDHLKYSLFSMLEQADLLSSEFQAAAANGNDYNGQDHKKLVQNMHSILAQVDTIRSNIAEMQSIEQRLNYHLLLKALLKEIYGEKKATPAPYDDYLLSYFMQRY